MYCSCSFLYLCRRDDGECCIKSRHEIGCRILYITCVEMQCALCATRETPCVRDKEGMSYTFCPIEEIYVALLV